MIRLVKHEDIPALVSIGKAVLARSPTYEQVALDANKARYMVRRSMSDKSMDTFVAEVDGQVVGFLVALEEEHWFSKSRYATDLAFLVMPIHAEQAVWLLRRFIRWATGQPKVDMMMMGISSGLDEKGRLAELYKRHGFRDQGGVFVRKLK